MLTLPGLGAERTLQSTYGYNNEGQMTSMTYPTVANSTGRTLTTGLDAMARPVSMSDNQNEVTVNSVGYNHRSQMTSMSGPAGTVGWGFNELGQLTSMSAAGITETYSYAPGANNGRIVKKVTNGEEVVYQYDAVNRLIQSTAQSWVETYSHDGFGNLVGRTGPNPISLPINPATNKFSGASDHDARGNFVANGTYQYDLENRLAIANRTLDQGNDLYAYGHGNKRIYKRVEQDGQANKHYVFLYGAGGERIGHYEVTSTSVVRLTEWYYFAGRQVAESMGTILGVVTDRLGNVRKRGSTTLDYYPYGQEKPGPTGNEVAKFGTYFRDAGTGLDYADQRHYAATYGRFMSPDPYQASGGPGDPGSWNRFAYVGGDPMNRVDPTGLDYTLPDGQPFDPSNPGNVSPGGTSTTVTASAPVLTFQFAQQPYGLGEENEVPALCMQRIPGVAGLALSVLTWDHECNQFMYPGHPLYEAALRADQAHACKQGVDQAIAETRRRLSDYLNTWVPDPDHSVVALGVKGGIGVRARGNCGGIRGSLSRWDYRGCDNRRYDGDN